MAKKRKSTKKSKSGGVAAVSPWTAAAGGVIGNAVGMLLAEAVASYLGGGEKKKTKALKKMLRQVTSQLVS